MIGMTVVFPWAVGMVLFGGIGYLLRNWRHTTITFTLLNLLLLVSIWYEFSVGDCDDGRFNVHDDDES